MLAAVGAPSLEQLVEVPAAVRLREKLDVVPALSESDIVRRFEHFASKNGGKLAGLVLRGRRVPSLRSAGHRGARDAG